VRGKGQRRRYRRNGQVRHVQKLTGHGEAHIVADRLECRMLRLYWPEEAKPSIIDGSWVIPPVTRVS
jgi:hypothetical protein